MNNLDLNEVANQLRCPSGQAGEELAEVMFKSNSNMIYKTVDRLQLYQEDTVLEIGFGSAKHLPYIFSAAQNLSYYGVEISALMLEMGAKVKESLSQEKIELKLADELNTLSYPDKFFNHCFSVNTVYFWNDPVKYFTEIYRVLKPGGSIALSYIREDFAQQQPFATEDVFHFYRTEWLIRIMTNIGYSHVERWQYIENTLDKVGNKVIRPFVVLKGKK
ncbi:class I SAM-dependent methyltransferase [Myroides sp. 1354]|uniref:class I SAM-dependent methyltransferase n=1 Tax=unclassified Myroides TaxID=2642485 RepID=UPI002577754E|nr:MULTISPECIES: class I SAM-dependent methyltransferase [unclassified Myroides]MDM1043786.1 class I SAM-dependent methyltransferase [Myroides sp. R163-1]MDM1054721.1 class I SAM-dependent methyltransferase [Myroides sp. 1354]MDM1068018.1 class I SAM-dependent methyltransferase [Myroides sp. 1372]